MGGSKRIFKPRKTGNIISRNWRGYRWINGVMMTAKQARANDAATTTTSTRSKEMATQRPTRALSTVRAEKAGNLVREWLASNPGWHSWPEMWANLSDRFAEAGYEKGNEGPPRAVAYTLADRGDIERAYNTGDKLNRYAAKGTDLGKDMLRVKATLGPRRRKAAPMPLNAEGRPAPATATALVPPTTGMIQVEVHRSDGRVFMRNGGMLLEINGQLKFSVGDTIIEIGVR